MSLFTPTHQQRLADLINDEWDSLLSGAGKVDKIVLFHEAKEVLCRTACQWVGLPLDKAKVKD